MFLNIFFSLTDLIENAKLNKLYEYKVYLTTFSLRFSYEAISINIIPIADPANKAKKRNT